ncbi:chromosome segregation protein SMC [Sedimentibacter sp. MB31-C6]|uniref:chromosome segregation protein SMC n=1 Tax=Sedimentibacter sp. MB31-C6 TaxID=3109366 RepID=UPI002DDD22AB|nr:chromosome segregation protein SMC [Sedimentibacter sp. MB36-C1]WSI04139.1 chromosome segregation protein SMC [Sedimentibacter sp. MB36-C1]
MFLKKIYVNGFKSFAEKTDIMVEKGITAIVGPNGSGKSNISDAIKWVLGEQSAKSLRGGKMDDVIFAGTQKRMPLGYAEVNLIFNNESGIIPIEYKEVSIKRKLYKTGESEYYINKQQCRLKDIKELFMDTGIGRDGYSFIGQGRVEDILSPNSDTRREVFEEAAGIVKFKTRKEESKRKLEKTNDNLDRVEDIIHELEERLEPLKEQSNIAQKYINLKSDLKKYELNYFVREYEKHNEALKLLDNQKKQTIEEKEKLQKRREAFSETIMNQKEKINSLQEKIKEVEEILLAKNKEYENYLSLSHVHSEKSLLYKNNINNIQEEIESLIKRNQEIQNSIEELKIEKVKYEESLKSNTDKFNSMNSEILGYKAEIDKIVNAIEKERNDLFELNKEINKLNSTKSTIESFMNNDTERIQQLSNEITEEETENNNKNDIIIKIKNEQNEIKEKLTLEKQELKEEINKFKIFEDKKNNLEAEINRLRDELSSTKSKHNILSNMEAYYDGYFKSIKVLMNKKDNNAMLKKNILGTVGDIIKTKKEYETAIEIALGSAIQNIIVKGEKEAEAIIDYLKESKIGRVTFLPIDSIQERSLNQFEKAVLYDPCVINTGDKLVETDTKYNKVIKHLLGRILIVDTLNNGFKISKKIGGSIKIVSLQGDVINSGGSVTGGHVGRNQNFLGRKREIEECKILIEKDSKNLEIKNNELSKLVNDLKLCNESINKINNDISEKNNLYNMSESKKNMLQEQVEKTSVVINKYLKELNYIEEEKAKREKEILDIENQKEICKEKIDLKEKNIENIALQNDDNKKKYEEYNSIILKQRDQVSQINQDIKLIEEKISNFESEIQRNKNNKNSKIENLENTEREIQKATELINEYTIKIEKLKIEINDINIKYSNDKENLSKIQNEIYEFQNKINDANKALTDALDDENSMNVKIEREKSRIEDISTKLWEEYELNYAMALNYKDDSVSQSRLYNDVNKYKKAIKELGNINLNAIEEYKEVKDRYQFLTKQKKDLIDAKEQLNDVIKELELKMKDRFLEEFTNIRLKFNEVFTKLFNGGKGDVYLEDEADALNSNIEIAIQPPGKKLSKISLLSGGEKALTAIALLFAILKTKPTPFCILDEIEAALDDVNIVRFSQYLKEFSKETQFIVITHRKGTMENSDILYGVTMEEKGVTKLVSLKLSDVDDKLI